MDIRGNICKYYYLLLMLSIEKLSFLSVRFKAFLFGIKLGKKCKFWGSIRLYRKPYSSIIIGNNCSFRSISDSNLIGINHKCIIGAHNSEAKIIIGDNCGFSGTVIGAFKEINIGNNVRCGANTLITDGDWHPEDTRIGESKPIMICDNVWLGINTIVLKGVTIGKNSLIGANSVVTKDIPENVMAAGNPCKVISPLRNSTKDLLQEVKN